MIYSDYLENETHSSKWDRVRMNYDHAIKVLRAKEHQACDSKPTQLMNKLIKDYKKNEKDRI